MQRPLFRPRTGLGTQTYQVGKLLPQHRRGDAYPEVERVDAAGETVYFSEVGAPP